MDNWVDTLLEDGKLVLQLALALIISAVVGWERESRNREAGLRTHMMVGLGATLFIGLGPSLVEFMRPETGDAMRFDPTRLLEAVAVGVGFLGAGTIYTSQKNNEVHGLTTAASIWAVAALGIAVALERWVLAICGALLVVGVLRGVHVVQQRLKHVPSED